jgi:hypothetical protein
MTIDLSSDRAEDLSKEEILRLFVEQGDDGRLVQRLMSPGADLLQGSRGTGKTMMLRVAYERIRANRSSVLPVFLSFSRYLSTTNPGSRSPDYSTFHSWVIAKLLQAFAAETPSASGSTRIANVPIREYIERLESHYKDPSVSNRSATAAVLGVKEEDLVEFDRLDSLVPTLHRMLDEAGRSSVTFLLDEATQNFAEELQPQFFRVIRRLRDARVAVKIAVYPQATVYGREFDVGQDAKVLRIERDVEDSNAMEFFVELLRRRTGGSDLWTSLEANPSARDFLVKMSGGNPRWLLHLFSGLPADGQNVTAAAALGLAKDFPDSTLWPYINGLKHRLLTKRRYVENAIALARIFIDDLRQLNRNRDRPSPYVAVSQSREIPYRARAAVGLLEYSGLIYRRGPKRITARENAEMYFVHPALLVKENCLFPQMTNPSLEMILKALTDPPRELVREYSKSSPRLLSDLVAEEKPDVCDECGTTLPEGAKYCPNCGRAVQEHSLFQELRNAPSSELELTPGVRGRLTGDEKFRTVGSVLDATPDQVDQIPYVGEVRVRLIKAAAEEFVAG